MLLQISGEKADLSTDNVNIINFPDDIVDSYTSKLKPTVCQKNHKHGQKISNTGRIQHILHTKNYYPESLKNYKSIRERQPNRKLGKCEQAI